MSYFRYAVLLLVWSCGASKTDNAYQITDSGPPKIIFLNYRITKQANNKKRIILSSKRITDGKIKHHHTPTKSETGDFQCEQIDKSGTILRSQLIKNPFIKTIEYIDNANHLKTNQVHVDNTSLSLRLQLHSETAYIVISDIADLNVKPTPLIKTKVNR